jgi:hypothetical protein
VGTQDLDEAHYICALINSPIFNLAVQSFSQKGGKSFGTPQILESVRIPKFDKSDTNHITIANFSVSAHAATHEI